MPRAYRRFTKEEDVLLVELRLANPDKFGVRRIAKILGRSPQAVRWRLYRIAAAEEDMLSYPAPGWDKEEDEIAIELYKEGMGCRRIGNQIGRTRNAVRYRLERLGVYRDMQE